MSSIWKGNCGTSTNTNNINTSQGYSNQNQLTSNVLQNSPTYPYGFLYQKGNIPIHPPYYNPSMLPFTNFGNSNQSKLPSSVFNSSQIQINRVQNRQIQNNSSNQFCNNPQTLKTNPVEFHFNEYVNNQIMRRFYNFQNYYYWNHNNQNYARLVNQSQSQSKSQIQSRRNSKNKKTKNYLSNTTQNLINNKLAAQKRNLQNIKNQPNNTILINSQHQQQDPISIPKQTKQKTKQQNTRISRMIKTETVVQQNIYQRRQRRRIHNSPNNTNMFKNKSVDKKTTAKITKKIPSKNISDKCQKVPRQGYFKSQSNRIDENQFFYQQNKKRIPNKINMGNYFQAVIPQLKRLSESTYLNIHNVRNKRYLSYPGEFYTKEMFYKKIVYFEQNRLINQIKLSQKMCYYNVQFINLIIQISCFQKCYVQNNREYNNRIIMIFIIVQIMKANIKNRDK